MTKRTFLAAAFTAACVLAASLWGGGSALAQRGAGASVTNGRVNPTKLPGTGGTVNVRVKVTPRRGVVIHSVRAKASVPGGTGFGASSTLQALGRNLYSGTVRVGANRSTNRARAQILVDVDTSTVDVTNKRIGTVTLQGLTVDPNQPPPPPDI